MKCVLVGDGNVGKTCLIVRYTANAFPVKYRSIISERYIVYVEVEGKLVQLNIYDTSGQADKYPNRSLSYPGTDVFIICFSLDDPTSLENVQKKWYPELRQHCPNTPFILVGTKMDIKRDEEKKKESQVKGHAMAKVIGAICYLEVSALAVTGLKEIFHGAIRVAWCSPANRRMKHSHSFG